MADLRYWKVVWGGTQNNGERWEDSWEPEGNLGELAVPALNKYKVESSTKF